MQEFENGQEVEVVTILGSGKAKYIALNECEHIVEFMGKVAVLKDRYVSPIQLICDKAREKLHTTIQYKVKVDSDALLAEFNKYRKEWTGYLVLNTDRCTSHDIAFYNDYNAPELNLSTGEIVPCEVSKGVDMTIKSAYNIIAELRVKLKDKDDALVSMSDNLKEKDAEIELLKKAVQSEETHIKTLKSNFEQVQYYVKMSQKSLNYM